MIRRQMYTHIIFETAQVHPCIAYPLSVQTLCRDDRRISVKKGKN